MVDNDSVDFTSSGRSFRVCGPTTGKAQLSSVVSLTSGTPDGWCQQNREVDIYIHEIYKRICVESVCQIGRVRGA